MFRGWTLSAFLILFVSFRCLAQPPGKPTRPDTSASARSATALAESGQCAEALPSLKTSLAHTSDKELKRKIGLDGVHCAMTTNQFNSAVEFLQMLTRDFPKDPEVLYVAVHAYSDLSSFNSEQLARNAPNSIQAHELSAESYEMQGKWDSAEKEYRAILILDPKFPGIHFRLGRLLLSKPNPSPEAAQEAKQDFEQELKIDPSNAGAEYVLGEMARQSQKWEDAATHFSRAAKLDNHFSEAYLGLGVTLMAEKKYPDAIAPLETAVKLDPQNPDAHYNLATAYTRAGRKQDGEKEFAIHQKLIGEQPAAPGGATPPPQNQNQ